MSDQDVQCFISMSKHCVIDTLKPDGRTVLCNESLDEVKLRHPDAQQMSLSAAVYELQSSLVDKDVTEITQEQFDEALGALPPNQWVRYSSAESFKSSEHLSGAITAIYVRLGSKFYTFNDYCHIKHEEIVTKVLDSIKRKKL
jgi:hypothetical protein